MVVRCSLIQWAVCPYKVLLWRGSGISHYMYLIHGMRKVGRPEEPTYVDCNTRS